MTRIIKGKNTAQKVLQLFAWSFSRWKDYKQCPALARYKHIDKLKEPDHPASARGNAVHENGAQYVSGKTDKLLPDFKYFKKDMARLRKLETLVEQEWAFDEDWNVVDWFDMKRARCRVKVDAHYLQTVKKGSSGSGKFAYTTIVIIDYKTGKVHEEEHKMQRDLYALVAMMMYPDASAVLAAHWYLDSGDRHEDDYTRDDFERLKKEWFDRTVPMLRDRRFAPRPGNGCRWCNFSKSKGGPCRF